MTARRLQAWLRFLLVRHGWPTWIGLLLILSALGGQQWVVAPALSQVEAVRAQLPALRRQSAQAPVEAQTDTQRLAAALAALPAPAGALAAVDTLHRRAARHGVVLSHGEYRLLPPGSAPWARYQITLPAQGSYRSLRAWLADAMNAEPTLALDELSLRRGTVGDATVEMRVRLTLFLRGAT